MHFRQKLTEVNTNFDFIFAGTKTDGMKIRKINHGTLRKQRKKFYELINE